MESSENMVPVKETLEPFCMGCPFIAIVTTPCFANNALQYIQIECANLNHCIRAYLRGGKEAIDGRAETGKQ